MAFGVIGVLFVAFISFALGVAFGITTDDADFKGYWIPVLGMIGGWVSGLGALTAVVVSLWLAHKQSREDTELVDGSFFEATNGREDFFALTIVSKGKRPAKVRSITLGGLGAKKHLFVAQWGVGSNDLPAFLNYGEDAFFRFRDDFGVTINEFITNNLDGIESRLRVIVSTTVKTYEFKLYKPL